MGMKHMYVAKWLISFILYDIHYMEFGIPNLGASPHSVFPSIGLLPKKEKKNHRRSHANPFLQVSTRLARDLFPPHVRMYVCT